MANKEIKYEIIMGVQPIEFSTHKVKQVFYKVSDEHLEVNQLFYAFPAGAGVVFIKYFLENDEVEVRFVSQYTSNLKQKFHITDLKKLIASTDPFFELPILTQEEIDKYFE